MSLFVLNSRNGGPAVWGSITGTLSDQTDLQSALNAITTGYVPYTGATSNLNLGSFSLQTFSILNSAGALALDVDGLFMVDFDGFTIMDGEGRSLFDVNGTIALSFSARQTLDTSGFASSNWGTRNLIGADGTTAYLNWNTGLKLVGDTIVSNTTGFTPTARLHVHQTTGVDNFVKISNQTTGTLATDGFDVGVNSSGDAQLRQRENLPLTVWTNNTVRASWSGAGILDLTGTTAMRGTDGSAAAPFYSFTAGTTAGMYRSGTNQISFSTTSTERMRIDSSGKLTIYQGTTLRGALATVYTQSNSVGNVGTGEDTLHTFSVPSSGFFANNDSFEVIGAGTFAANANNKRIKLIFGAVTLFDTTALAFNSGDWLIRARIFRITTTTAKAIITWQSSNATLATVTDYVSVPTFNFLTTNVLRFTGEATADNDVVQELMQVFWVPVS